MKQPLPDYYAILGISKTASNEEIKKAYRELCKTHHPDKGGDADKMKEINIAYDTLSNPEKRKQYDDPVSDPQFNPFQGGNPFQGANPFGGINLEDILNNIHGFRFETNFGGGNQHRTVMLSQHITVPFLKALDGGELTVFVSQLNKSIKFSMPPLETATAEFKIRIEGSKNNTILLNLQVVVEMPRGLSDKQKQDLRNIFLKEVKPETNTTGSVETTTS